MAAALIFWVAAGLLVYSYVVYPQLLGWLTKRRAAAGPAPSPGNRTLKASAEGASPGAWPKVSILMAVYNEARVLPAKLESVFALDYPPDKLELVVGSDGSTDGSDDLLNQAAAAGLPVRFIRLEGRNGKASVLNALRDLPELGEVLLLTDANVLFDRDLLKALVPRLLQPRVGVVSAFVLHSELSLGGIAVQESQYINRENTMKHQEGLLWGTMMGAFGACYAIRRELFPRLPANFLMEDFYVTMHVLAAGFQAVSEPAARCFEDLPGSIQQEFRRKVRISTGNVQNLKAWRGLLWPPSALAFAFFSHKIIRWMGPLLLLACLLASAVLAANSAVYSIVLVLQALLMLSSLMDQGLSRLGIRVGALRLIGYFYTMNLALLVGFYKYFQGVQNSAWQPTARTSTHV